MKTKALITGLCHQLYHAGNAKEKKIFETSLVMILAAVFRTEAWAGSITGEVRSIDESPQIAAVKVSKDQDYCGETLPNEIYLISPLGGSKTLLCSSRLRQAPLRAIHRKKIFSLIPAVFIRRASMLAYIHVFDHAYFTMTDAQGSFTISNLPAGTDILKAWHEAAGIKSQEIIVPKSGDARAVLSLQRDDQANHSFH